MAVKLHIRSRIMTAGVQQSIEPSAYLPSPSTSPADAKKAGSADGGNTGTQGEPQDFQTELKLQESDSKESRPSSRPETGSGRADSKGDPKSDSKKDSSSDDLNVVAAVPVQVTEPVKTVQPIEPDLSIPAEGARCEQSNPTPPVVEPEQTPEAKATDSAGPALAGQAVEQPQQRAAAGVGPSSPKTDDSTTPPNTRAQRPAGLRTGDDGPPMEIPSRLPVWRSARSQQSRNDSPAKQVAEIRHCDPQATPENSRVLTPASLLAEATPDQPEDQQSSVKEAPASENQPVARIELDLPSAPPEPVASAIQDAQDPAPARAGALAFAARMASVPQQAGDSSVENTASTRPIPNVPLSRIPIRYAPTAQIIQNAEGSDPDVDRAPRVIETRSDLVFSRAETAHQTASVSDAAPAQETVPTARAERVIEPPAAAPSSTHDIRVRVPDNNGGATQVRFVESGGEVKVSVRADDPTLAQSLRTHLNDLTQRLADGGIPAEIWKPGSSAASSENNPQTPDRGGRGSDGQQSGGDGGQQHRDEQRPAWLEELEASLDAQA